MPSALSADDLVAYHKAGLGIIGVGVTLAMAVFLVMAISSLVPN